jgi:hypothetical protein
MYQYQGIALPLGDQPGPDNSLANTRRCNEDPGIMIAQDINGLILDGREFAIKLYIERLSGMPLVVNAQCTAIFLEQNREFILTSPGQGDMLGKLLGAADHPWCQCR